MEKRKYISFLYYEVKREKIKDFLFNTEEKLSGARGISEKRDKIVEYVERYNSLFKDDTTYETDYSRRKAWKNKMGKKLSRLTFTDIDEHGSSWERGDHHDTDTLDYIPYRTSQEAPYCNMSKDEYGMALIEVTRKRVYAKSSSWSPSYTSTRFLVGQNETGTFFSHSVSRNCDTVKEALKWIWQGRENDILIRQGDIALIKGKGPKIPSNLPGGHTIEGEYITHETHAPLRLPAKGERIIVGKRAAEMATSATRD